MPLLRRSTKLREATLGGVSALDARPPRGGAKARAPAAGRGVKAQSPGLRRVRAHLALIVGSAGFSAIMIGIILNATVMQKEHHPAPLFGTAVAPVRVAAAPPAMQPDTGLGLVPALPAPSMPVALPSVAAASPPMVTAVPLANASKAAARVPRPSVAPRPAKPADGIARFLEGSHASPHVVAAEHGPARPVSTQPRSAAAPRLRPAGPVATRSQPVPAAVN